MDNIKYAFDKVKEDILSINNELTKNKNNNSILKEKLDNLCDIVINLNQKMNSFENMLNNNNNNNNCGSDDEYNQKKELDDLDRKLDKQTDSPTEIEELNTNSSSFQTYQTYIKPRKAKIQVISKGNEGVQTNRQTDKQTNIRHKNSSYNQEKSIFSKKMNTQDEEKDSVNLAGDILDSLDSIKKEIRLKFKRLTDQEMIVFSTIYQLEEEIGYSDYKSLSKKLNLSESSIRDYVRRLINKQIPILKNKINNKEIHLSISSNLKKITSLNTILELKNL